MSEATYTITITETERTLLARGLGLLVTKLTNAPVFVESPSGGTQHARAGGASVSTADSKPVTFREITQAAFLLEREHLLCAVVIGPDRDGKEHKVLHLRVRADTFELLRSMPLKTRKMIMEHQERLWREFVKQVLA